MQVLYRSSPSLRSWEAIKKIILAALVCTLMGAATLFISSQGLFSKGLAVLIILGLIGCSVLWIYLWRRGHLFIVTDRGVINETGFLVRTNQREMSLRRIQMIDVRQNILERLILKTGDVLIGSASSDRDQDQIVFLGVAHPQRVAGIIREGEYSREPAPAGYNPYQAEQPWGSQPPAGPAPWDRSQDASPQQPSPWDQDRPPLPPDSRY